MKQADTHARVRIDLRPIRWLLPLFPFVRIGAYVSGHTAPFALSAKQHNDHGMRSAKAPNQKPALCTG